MGSVIKLQCECGKTHPPVFGKRINAREVGIAYWCGNLGRHIIAIFHEDGGVDITIATYGKGERQ